MDVDQVEFGSKIRGENQWRRIIPLYIHQYEYNENPFLIQLDETN